MKPITDKKSVILNERRRKLLLKTLSWRMFASGTTFIMAYVTTRELGVAIGLTLGDSVIKTLIYYLHEKIWDEEMFNSLRRLMKNE